MNRFRPPARTPSPKPFTRKCTAPPAEGNAAPSLAYEYVDKSATTPPTANDSHIALPATWATTPRMEKIPAPTIPPMPIETAAARPICDEFEPGCPTLCRLGFELGSSLL